VKRLHPDLPVRQGDVTRLDATDGFYGAYISLGVMEHRREGPEPFLVEAFRVVRDGGVMLVSVPFFNRFRALKAAVGFYRGSVGDREFYQYAYSKETFSDILERHGFRVVERIPYDAAKGLSDEVPGMRRFLAGPFGRRLRGRLMRSDAANRVFGHMMLYVAVKTARAVAA
jgi:SAM-dependent methyltransferase